MPTFLLLGLCEPLSEEDQPGFDEWFVNQHIEDTTHCPGFVKGEVFKLSGPHLDISTPSKYLSVYEVEADTYEAAEKQLNDWQADQNAWPGRKHHLQTMQKYGGNIPMKINGSGWFELIKSYQGPAHNG